MLGPTMDNSLARMVFNTVTAGMQFTSSRYSFVRTPSNADGLCSRRMSLAMECVKSSQSGSCSGWVFVNG